MSKPFVKMPKIDINLSASNCARKNTHGYIDPQLFVIHTAECKNIPNSTADIRGMYNYLCTTPDRLWVHFAIDMDGYLAQGAYIRQMCYHARGANDRSVGCELIGRAATKRKEWVSSHRRQLLKLSELIAGWSSSTGVPIKKSRTRGVCGHVHIKEGGHTDPGKGFPYRTLLRDARYYKKHHKHLPRKLGGLL